MAFDFQGLTEAITGAAKAYQTVKSTNTAAAPAPAVVQQQQAQNNTSKLLMYGGIALVGALVVFKLAKR